MTDPGDTHEETDKDKVLLDQPLTYLTIAAAIFLFFGLGMFAGLSMTWAERSGAIVIATGNCGFGIFVFAFVFVIIIRRSRA